MGRLVIAHHKSYHPYRADNIERVKQDEEEAKLQEAKEEGRLRLADTEARIDLLRKRAGIRDNGKGKSRARDEDDLIPEAVRASVADQGATGSLSINPTSKQPPLTSKGHFNLFADLEEHEVSLKHATTQALKHKSRNKDESGDTDKGHALAPSEADRTPWYTKLKEAKPQLEENRRVRDEHNKSRYDPLTEITTSLARSSSKLSSSRVVRRSYPMDPPAAIDSALSERLKRESTERARAAELRERRRREKAGSETPSTVAGGYANQYNKQDVEDARKRREDSQGWRHRVSVWQERDPKDRDDEHRGYRHDRDRSWSRQR